MGVDIGDIWQSQELCDVVDSLAGTESVHSKGFVNSSTRGTFLLVPTVVRALADIEGAVVANLYQSTPEVRCAQLEWYDIGWSGNMPAASRVVFVCAIYTCHVWGGTLGGTPKTC